MSKRIQHIIVKYLTNQASFLELDELETWIQDPVNEKLFNDYVKINYAIEYSIKKFNPDNVKEKLLKVIDSERKIIRLKRARINFRYTAAAIFIGILTTTYFFKNNLFNKTFETTPAIVNTNTIIPGTNKATLTLENGSTVILEKGSAFKTQNASSNGEKIIYKSNQQATTEIAYNYLTIPRGGQYFLKLSDGTQVWLNSESQLKFPISFVDGETRKVELVYGEAYFDVSPSTEHKGSKFKVINRAQEVEVIGTEFNIKAYKDEANVYTTLVEGIVTIDNGISKQNLMPNQQSNLNKENKSISVANVNVEEEISWKNGIFSFKGKPLKDIMKVISRWYDVDVVFENKNMESVKFKGILDKKQSIEEILSIMKSSTLNNYEIRNKTIILK